MTPTACSHQVLRRDIVGRDATLTMQLALTGLSDQMQPSLELIARDVGDCYGIDRGRLPLQRSAMTSAIELENLPPTLLVGA